MAQIDFSTLKARQAVNQGGGNGNFDSSRPRVGYFALKDDGDEAVVRFMHDSPADFDIVAVHPFKIAGKPRKINCIRGAGDPVEACPFCDAGEKLQYRFYIHLIEYTKDEQGHVVATPKVWERATNYADTLKTYCDEYPPLSDNIFKVKRNGAAGSMDTSYSIVYANPNVYKAEAYPKHEEFFEGYKAVGNAVLDKDAEGMLQLLEEHNQAVVATPKYAQVAAAPARTYSTNNAPAFDADPPKAAPVVSNHRTVSAGTAIEIKASGEGLTCPSGSFTRPRRFYQ